MFLFKLNPVGFYLLLVQQVFYVYCQFHMLLYYYVIWISKLYHSKTHTEHSLEGTRGAGVVGRVRSFVKMLYAMIYHNFQEVTYIINIPEVLFFKSKKSLVYSSTIFFF